MILSGLTVAVAAPLSFSDHEWEEALLFAVETVCQSEGEVIEFAHEQSEIVDLLFVLYQATDHARLVDEVRLLKLLQGYPKPVRRLCVFCCGRSRAGAVSEADVRSLADAHSHGFAQFTVAGRGVTPAVLTDFVSSQLDLALRKSRLIARGESTHSDSPLGLDMPHSHSDWDAEDL